MQAIASVNNAFTEAPVIAAAGRQLPEATMNELKSVAQRIAQEIVGRKDLALALKDLAEADVYTIRHSLDVCVVGLLIAKRMFQYETGWEDERGQARYDAIEEKLARLGFGLLLHDIGKLMIPTPLLHRDDLREEEIELVRSHTLLGAEMIKGDHISPMSRAVVRSHHERWDGTGYPAGQAGKDINQFARIAAVANVFDSMTSERPGKPARSIAEGVEEIVLGSGTYFDPDVVSAFRKVIAPYPPGTEVILSDGALALVREVPDSNLSRPIVRVIADEQGMPVSPPKEVDLRDYPDLFIVSSE
jgi:HD-GYP domain-containing protein (c-di-GMP phosphodiesterase class II)